LRNPNGEADYQDYWKQFRDHNSKLEKSHDFGQGVSNPKVTPSAPASSCSERARSEYAFTTQRLLVSLTPTGFAEIVSDDFPADSWQRLLRIGLSLFRGRKLFGIVRPPLSRAPVARRASHLLLIEDLRALELFPLRSGSGKGDSSAFAIGSHHNATTASDLFTFLIGEIHCSLTNLFVRARV
jgi:hypothetical protein